MGSRQASCEGWWATLTQHNPPQSTGLLPPQGFRQKVQLRHHLLGNPHEGLTLLKDTCRSREREIQPAKSQTHRPARKFWRHTTRCPSHNQGVPEQEQRPHYKASITFLNNNEIRMETDKIEKDCKETKYRIKDLNKQWS